MMQKPMLRVQKSEFGAAIAMSELTAVLFKCRILSSTDF
jgi:hypothetical protein